ncbi:DUF421 domain-containing protein [Bacillus sp. FJAT-28004]|uniref:DUF421 domain-containing protein n=1 Tax=Bacillus sp. FJAT-28004 TaxID=1679165 RepID=UPI0006B65000|nr:DUF421 domain-containing protein [Bacillus sp. FJAT-28004]
MFYPYSDGKFNYRNLSKAKLQIEFLYAELRKSNVEDITKVAFAAWEPGGTLSVFVNTAYRAVTPTDLKLSTQPFNLTKPIIIDGQMEHALLCETGKDRAWLEKEIRPLALRNVILSNGGQQADFAGARGTGAAKDFLVTVLILFKKPSFCFGDA